MSEHIDDAAAAWFVAQHRDDMDWDAFTHWLEADARHPAAFDAIALLDERIDRAVPDLRSLAESQPTAPPRARRPARWLAAGGGLAVAAALALVFVSPASSPRPLAYRTAPGQARDIALLDGSKVALASGSVLRATGERGAMTLEGHAIFDVRHDPDHPLIIQAGAYEVRDIGTRFDLSEDGGILRVAVFEGRVSVRSPKIATAIEVPAGQVFTTVAPDTAATLVPLRASQPSDAAPGRLVYDDVPLGLVAADIARATGELVQIDPIPARRRFSGVLATTNRGTMVSTLSELAGLRMRTENDAIRLSDRTGR